MEKKEVYAGSLRTGVLLLTVANLLVKVLGFLYKVPLNAILGDEMANVNAAAALFALLYTVIAAGIPGALAVSVSRARAMGDGARIRVLLSSTLRLLLAVGFFAAVAVLLLAHPISRESGDGGAYLCTLAIAPALFFVSLTGVLRGFFQGFSSLVPTAVSEILEALGKVGFGVAFALLALRALGRTEAAAASLAVFGITLGVMMGAGYLALLYRRRARGMLLSVAWGRDLPFCTTREARRTVLAVALPITLSAALLSLSTFIDAQLMRPLLSRYFADEALAKALYSDYSTGALTLYNLPLVLVTPISAALIPYIGGTVAAGERERAKGVTGAAVKLASLVSFPSALGLSAFAAPLLSFVFRADGDMAENAGPLLAVLAFCVVFSALLTLGCAILQAAGRERLPIFSLGVGVLVKLILMHVLVPRMGAVGVPLSTLGVYVVASLLNLVLLMRCGVLRIRIFDSFVRPLFCAAVSVLLSRMTYTGVLDALGADVSLLLAVLLAVLLYLALLFLLRAVGREEIALFPYGRRILGFFDRKK